MNPSKITQARKTIKACQVRLQQISLEMSNLEHSEKLVKDDMMKAFDEIADEKDTHCKCGDVDMSVFPNTNHVVYSDRIHMLSFCGDITDK